MREREWVFACVNLCVCMHERDRVWVCVCEREKKSVWLCVCVCVWITCGIVNVGIRFLTKNVRETIFDFSWPPHHHHDYYFFSTKQSNFRIKLQTQKFFFGFSCLRCRCHQKVLWMSKYVFCNSIFCSTENGMSSLHRHTDIWISLFELKLYCTKQFIDIFPM